MWRWWVSRFSTVAVNTSSAAAISDHGLTLVRYVLPRDVMAMQAYVGGEMVSELVTDATSSTAGATMLHGGLSVAKMAYIGTGAVVETGGIYVHAGGATVNAGGLTASARADHFHASSFRGGFRAL